MSWDRLWDAQIESEARPQWAQITGPLAAEGPAQNSSAKLGTVFEEADETLYWLEVMEEAGLLPAGKL